MSWMAPASEALALRVGGEFALLLYKGVRSARKGSAELGAHGKAVTTQGAFGGHRRQCTAPRLE